VNRASHQRWCASLGLGGLWPDRQRWHRGDVPLRRCSRALRADSSSSPPQSPQTNRTGGSTVLVVALSRAAREIETLQQQRASAEQRHTGALADWYTGGQQGQRPGSDASELDERIADAKAAHDAHDSLRATVLAEKVDYVKRNRKSLARTATAEVAKAKTNYEQQIDALEQARETLIDARATELWAKAYPHEALTATPPTYALAGGVKRLCNRWFSALNSPLDAAPMFGLLKDDAMFLAEVISVDLKAAIRGVRPELLRDDQAVWGGSEEDLEQKKRDQLRARERHATEWGRAPVEYGS